MIRENLNDVKENIVSACRASNRQPQDVTLIAVSKTKPVELLRESYDAGVRVFGENKVQEILEKAPALPDDIRWHMIGHLQKNKVRQVIDKTVLIHSVDTVALAEQIEKEAAKKTLMSTSFWRSISGKRKASMGSGPAKFWRQLPLFPNSPMYT